MKVLVVLVAACIVSSNAAYNSYGGGYAGPLASPVVNPNGFLADTPEVAAAKAQHFTEVAKVSSPAGYAPGPYNGAPAYNNAPAPAYNNAPAPTYNSAPAPAYNSAPYQQHASNPYANNPSVTPQGYLADTPEIAAAKAAHFAEVAKTRTNPSYGPEAYDDGSYRPEYDNPSYNAPAPAPAPAYNSYSAPAAPSYPSYSAPAPSHGYSAPQQYSAPSHGSHYSGPLASPVVTPNGFLAETPEVAAAKAAHFAEVAKAGTPAHGRYRRSAILHTPAATAPLAISPIAYAAPYTYATPYYPHSGFTYSVRTW